MTPEFAASTVEGFALFAGSMVALRVFIYIHDFVARVRADREALASAERLLKEADQEVSKLRTEVADVRGLLAGAIESGRQEVRGPLEKEAEIRRAENLTLLGALEQRGKEREALEKELARAKMELAWKDLENIREQNRRALGLASLHSMAQAAKPTLVSVIHDEVTVDLGSWNRTEEARNVFREQWEIVRSAREQVKNLVAQGNFMGAFAALRGAQASARAIGVDLQEDAALIQAERVQAATEIRPWLATPKTPKDSF
jgi:hypothetical protein